MKNFLVVLGLSAVAMAGKCSNNAPEKSKESGEQSSEEFPVKEDSQVPTEEVPAYENQEETPSTISPDATPAPTETPGPNEGSKAPGN